MSVFVVLGERMRMCDVRMCVCVCVCVCVRAFCLLHMVYNIVPTIANVCVCVLGVAGA